MTEYEFGLSVAITGETIIVGTPRYRNYEHSVTPGADGAVFLFQEPAGGWAHEPHALETQTATLVPHESEVEEDGHFGHSVAIGSSGGEQTVVVGAPRSQWEPNRASTDAASSSSSRSRRAGGSRVARAIPRCS